MIVQIAADAREGMHDADAMALQEIRRPDARELQELRRLDRARRDDDFALGERLPLRAVDDELDSGRAESGREHPACVRMRDHLGWPAQRRRKKAPRRCSASIARRA